MRAAAPDIPVLVKIAPDMRHEEAIGLAELALAENIDGLIISNTTLARDGVPGSAYADEAGGASGAPLFDAATDMLRAVYRAVCQPNGGKLTLIGVGACRLRQRPMPKSAPVLGAALYRSGLSGRTGHPHETRFGRALAR